MEFANRNRNTLYLEMSCATERRGDWTHDIDLDGVERIVVGTGPGSFAGLRSAIAFAKGCAIGRGCEVFGLPSPCAIADGSRIAVIGDARCGKLWVAMFDGFALVRGIFQIEVDELKEFAEEMPEGFDVVTVDEKRIGALLAETFRGCYSGGRMPDGEGLRRFAENNPSALVLNPLPIYLNPAVRTASKPKEDK